MSVYDAYESHVEVSEESWYRAIRAVLPEEYRNTSDERAEAQLLHRLRQLSPQEREVVLESLGKIAGKIGRGLLSHAGTIGAIGGAALGTLVAGPAGTAVGGTLGRALGGAIQGGAGQSPGPPQQGAARQLPGRPSLPRHVPVGGQQSPAMVPPARGFPTSIPTAGSSGNQLLILVNNPDFLIRMLRVIMQNAAPGPRSRASESQDAAVLEAYGVAVSVFANRAASEARASRQVQLRPAESVSRSDDALADHVFDRVYRRAEQLRRARRVARSRG